MNIKMKIICNNITCTLNAEILCITCNTPYCSLECKDCKCKENRKVNALDHALSNDCTSINGKFDHLCLCKYCIGVALEEIGDFFENQKEKGVSVLFLNKQLEKIERRNKYRTSEKKIYKDIKFLRELFQTFYPQYSEWKIKKISHILSNKEISLDNVPSTIIKILKLCDTSIPSQVMETIVKIWMSYHLL